MAKMSKRQQQEYWSQQGAHVPIPFESFRGPDNKLIFNPMCYYRVVGWGAPKKGEWYLSGNPVQGWRAPNDLSQEFWIILPTYKAKSVQSYVRGACLTQD